MKLQFRTLNASEIKPKIAKINNGGVVLLLWKTPLADLNVLEDTLGSTDYQIVYPADGICRISIWDEEKKQWVSKEGVGEGTSPKTTSNDALNRAGTAWGIGRELYSVDKIFIYSNQLKTFKKDTDDAGNDIFSCYDEFKVLSVTYNGSAIASLEIGIMQYGKVHHTVKFCYYSDQSHSHTPSEEQAVPAAENTDRPVSSKNDGPIFRDDEEILIGNCKGQRYGDAKETALFKKFLDWAARSTTSYSSEACADQLRRFKILAKSA